MEYDKKAIAFFHKAHLYWDVCKYFILPVRLLLTLESTTKWYYWYLKNHIFINCSNMEYDKKAIAFFHKAHLYWDVWKYFILPVRLLITLESMTKWYYWYRINDIFLIGQILSMIRKQLHFPKSPPILGCVEIVHFTWQSTN